MKKIKFLELRNFIILFLIMVTILQYCNPGGIMPNRIKYSTVVDSIPYPVHDTIPYEVQVEVEVPYEVEVKVPYEVQVIQSVDTANILKDFYAKNKITETLTLPDGVGTLVLNQVVSENKIIERNISNSKIKKQIVLDTLRIPEVPKNKFYYGFNFSTNKEDFINSMGVGMMMKTKTDKIYRIDLGLNNRIFDGNVGKFSPYVGGGVYWKIKSKDNQF
jgi:hypothetical protein